MPVYNAARDLDEALTSIRAQSDAGVEIIVVDDGSTDDSAAVAARHGARVLSTDANAGPAAARNIGARAAVGDLLFFVDADVVLGPSALSRVRQALTDPSLAAIFGSYDAHPRHLGLVSQYRNLLHHYTHQHGRSDAFTFWSGCGAVRRQVFASLGGFDDRRFPRAMEDVELGYRMRRAGHRVRLDRSLQGTHLKRWTIGSVIRTDVAGRALPWSRLILSSGSAPADLNLRGGQRASVVLTLLTLLSLPLAIVWTPALWVALVAVLVTVALNRGILGFFRRERGLGFAIAAAPLLLVYFLCGAAGYAYAWCEKRLGEGY